MKYAIGIDIGSTTAKLVIAENGHVLYEKYERHLSRVREKTLELLEGASHILDGKKLLKQQLSLQKLYNIFLQVVDLLVRLIETDGNMIHIDHDLFIIHG